MARKKNQLPLASNSTSPWQDLPRRLLQSWPLKGMSCINYNVAAKSWKLPPKRCNPNSGNPTSSLPQLYNTKDPGAFEPQKLNFSFHKGDVCFPPWDNNGSFKCISLFLSSNDYHNHVEPMVVPATSLPTSVLYKQTNPIVSSTTIRPAAVRYKIEENSLFSQESAFMDTNSFSRRHMQLTNSFWFDGKFYALSLQGTLVVIQKVDSHLVITGVSSSRAVPTARSSHFRECLLGLDGEILLIFLVSTKSYDTVDNVEILRLQLRELAWEKVERLGDRAAFVGANYCLMVPASEGGCKGNCIYFTNSGADGWWVYDMTRGDISRSQVQVILCFGMLVKEEERL